MLNKDIDKIDNIFSIPFVEGVQETPFVLDSFNNLQTYNNENFSMNFSRGYSTGLLNNEQINNEPAHHITFDFDLFSDKPEILDEFCKDSTQTLKDMNNTIYEFFTKIISDEACDRINAGDLLSDFGVIPF